MTSQRWPSGSGKNPYDPPRRVGAALLLTTPPASWPRPRPRRR
jgi:hypothetical protein